MEIKFYLPMKMDRSDCGIDEHHRDLHKLLKLIRSGQTVLNLEFLPIFSHQDLLIILLKFGIVDAAILFKICIVSRKKCWQWIG